MSLKEDDPYTVTLERALELIQAKVIADANRIIQDFAAEKIQVLNGRYGPYVTDKAKNARVPKGSDPKTLTLPECQALLAAAPAKGTRGRFGRKFPAKTAANAAAEKTAVQDAPAVAAPAAIKAKSVSKTKPKAKAKAKAKAAPKAPAAGKKTTKRG